MGTALFIVSSQNRQKHNNNNIKHIFFTHLKCNCMQTINLAEKKHNITDAM